MSSGAQITLDVAVIGKCGAAVGVGTVSGSAGGVRLPGDLGGGRDVGACCLFVSILLDFRDFHKIKVNERRKVNCESMHHLLLADPMEKTGDSHFSPLRARSLYSVALELIPPGSLMSLNMLSSWVMA